MKKGIIQKQGNDFYVKFNETQYTEDGLDYQGSNVVEIHPDDVFKFNINDKNVGEEITFKITNVVDRRAALDTRIDVARIINQ
jgi:hypothetical protein